MTLYHYCTFRTFESIIENKELWLSDLLKSNDYTEGKIILNALRNMYAEDERLNPHFDFLWGSTLHNLSVFSVFGICMTPNGDFLNQWNGYGDQGRGVSIGFDKEIFESYSLNAGKPAGLREVKYGSEEAKEFLNNKIEKLVNLTQDPLNMDLTTAWMIGDPIGAWVMYVLADLFEYKDIAFAVEEESRLLGFTQEGGGSVNDPIEYLSLELCQFKKPIREIIMGPLNQISEEDIRSLLDANGFPDIKIKRSSIPLQ